VVQRRKYNGYILGSCGPEGDYTLYASKEGYRPYSEPCPVHSVKWRTVWLDPVSPPPVSVSLSVSGPPSPEVTFTIDAVPETHRWDVTLDFGDGTPPFSARGIYLSETTVQHTYSVEGSYVATVTATDVMDAEGRPGSGVTVTDSVGFTVTGPPPPPPPEYTLTISATIGGATDPAPGSYTYPEGTDVTVTAFPDPGYNFDHWELNGRVYTENPITVRMVADATLRAVFTEIPPPPTLYRLTVRSDPEINIPVEIDGESVGNTPLTVEVSSGTYTVTVTPPEGYSVDHWEDGEGNVIAGAQNTVTITISGDYTVVAVLTGPPPPPPPPERFPTLRKLFPRVFEMIDRIKERFLGR